MTISHFDKEKADKLAVTINAELGAMNRALTSAAGHAAAAGMSLKEARESAVPDGMWQKWVKDHCRIGPRQASNYIKLAENWHLIPDEKRASGLSIRQAMELTKENLEPSQGDEQPEDCITGDSEESKNPAPDSEVPRGNPPAPEQTDHLPREQQRATAKSQAANTAPVQPSVNRKADVQTLTFAVGTNEANVFLMLLKQVKELTEEAARNLSDELQCVDRKKQIADELEQRLAEALRH